MEALSKAILAIHVFAGFTSLVVFWIPMFVKKGSKLHRQVGKAYVNLMWVMVISAAYLCIKNYLTGHVNMAIFLGFIALITANPIWYGVAILKHKNKLPDSLKRNHILFNMTIVITGVLLLGYGIFLEGKNEGILMIIFGILGISSGKDVWLSYKNTTNESDWLKQHIVGMLSSAIAAYTAFFVFGGTRFIGNFFPGYWAVLPWVAPGVIGTILIKRYVKNYTRKTKSESESVVA